MVPEESAPFRGTFFLMDSAINTYRECYSGGKFVMEQVFPGIDLLSEPHHTAGRTAATPAAFIFLGLALLLCLGPDPLSQNHCLQIEQWVAVEGAGK